MNQVIDYFGDQTHETEDSHTPNFLKVEYLGKRKPSNANVEEIGLVKRINQSMNCSSIAERPTYETHTTPPQKDSIRCLPVQFLISSEFKRSHSIQYLENDSDATFALDMPLNQSTDGSQSMTTVRQIVPSLVQINE